MLGMCAETTGPLELATGKEKVQRMNTLIVHVAERQLSIVFIFV